MMRRILLASTCTMALAGTAFAADLPSQQPPPLYLSPVPVFLWTGPYLGSQIGYVWDHDAADAELNTKSQAQKAAASISAYTFGPGLDELGISLAGIRSSATALLDGPVGQGDSTDEQGQDSTLLVSAGRPAGQSEQAAVAGVAPNGHESSDEPVGAEKSAVPQPQDNGRAVHARAFDASAGTPLDPLRNRTYDLNYAKTVPSIH